MCTIQYSTNQVGHHSTLGIFPASSREGGHSGDNDTIGPFNLDALSHTHLALMESTLYLFDNEASECISLGYM